VRLAVPVALSTVASALPAPAALAVNVAVAMPFDWMVVWVRESVPRTAVPHVTGRPIRLSLGCAACLMSYGARPRSRWWSD
jgi:hypothetical protein